MTTTHLTIAAVLAGIACANPGSAPVGQWQQYATAEDAGWSSDRLAAARDFAAEIGSGAVFVTYRGHAVAAWGAVDVPFKNYSVRKSYVSALLGIHVQAGALDLASSLADLAIDDVHSLTPTERSATVTDLLASRSSIYLPAAYEPPGTDGRRPDRGSERPGTRWWYNNWDFNVIGGIVERAAGRDLFVEFEQRIARPLGMEDFSLDHAFAWLEPGKSRFPAHLFRMSARDMARFGHLYLHKGNWNGRQVVPAAWVEQSTALQVPFDRQPRGYGYMWWVDGADSTGAVAVERYDRFSARGNGGQHILVIPDLEIVMVHVAELRRGRGVEWNPLQELLSMILDARTEEPQAAPALGPLAPEPLGDAPVRQPPDPRLPVPGPLLDALPGDYLIQPADSLTFFTSGERLFMRDDGFEIEFVARADGRLFAPWLSVVIEPVIGSGGTTDSLIVLVGRSQSIARPVRG